MSRCPTISSSSPGMQATTSSSRPAPPRRASRRLPNTSSQKTARKAADHHSLRPRGSDPSGPLFVSLKRPFLEPLHGCGHFSVLEDQMHEPQEVLTPTEARQASPRRLNFRVLTTSLILAVAAAAA